MKYFDSHAHYYDGRFNDGSERSVDSLIGALFENNVSYIINVGTDPTTSRLAIGQAKKFERMYTALGIHPTDSRDVEDVDTALDDIKGLIEDKTNKCVCLGEIGLDYHYPDTDKEKQMLFFKEQMELAREMNIPVCIHDRDAHGDIMEVLRGYPDVRGVLHSFSGSVEMARELVEMGYMISFSGTLTFTNAKKPREVAAVVPHNNILIETDCPYLAPVPYRGKLNHSGYMKFTLSALADARGESETALEEQLLKNSLELFGVK
jgi:TatD DNase family protein